MSNTVSGALVVVPPGVVQCGHTDSASHVRLGATMAGKFIVTRDTGGEYRFVLTTAAGEVVASSEPYKQKGSAMNGIDAVRRLAADAIVDDRTESASPTHAD